MHTLDTEIGTATALVVDPDTAWRSIVAAMLHNLGVVEVEQCRSYSEAQARLEAAPRDIVVCADDSGAHGSTCAALRRARLLPASTLVVLTYRNTASAQHAQAVELADACLVQPYTEAALRDRLQHARHRQRSLADIALALSQGRHADVDLLSRARHLERGPFWVQALRIAAEMHLQLGNLHAARELFEAVLASRSLPWARLGLALALGRLGDFPGALDLLQRLLAEHPDHLEAREACAELQAELARRQRATAPARQRPVVVALAGRRPTGAAPQVFPLVAGPMPRTH